MAPALSHVTGWDVLFWPVLRLVWEPFSRKNSHFWQWEHYNPPSFVKPHFLQPESGAIARTDLWSNLYQTNFIWQKVAIITPDNKETPFRVGYVNGSGQEGGRLCTIVLTQPFAILCDPQGIGVFVLDESLGRQIPLKHVLYSEKWKLPRGMLLL